MCTPPPPRVCPVVVKSSLIPFDCVSLGAVRVLESEPTVLCDAAVGPYARMRAVGAVTIVVFALGLPITLAVVLARNWARVQLDQELRERGEGNSPLTNPHFHFRRRFRKVYEDYRPAVAYWKVVVLLRKLSLGLVVMLAIGYVLLCGACTRWSLPAPRWGASQLCPVVCGVSLVLRARWWLAPAPATVTPGLSSR
jgi:hypothetical protein